MNTNSMFLVVAAMTVFLAGFFYYNRRCLRVVQTSGDPEILRAYIGDFPNLVRSKLFDIYASQIEQCNTSDEAHRLAGEVRGLFNDLAQAADEKCQEIRRFEEESGLLKIKDSEEELFSFIWSRHTLSDDPVRSQAIRLISPFAESRIRGARNLKELWSCNAYRGVQVPVKTDGGGISFRRVFEPIYLKRLKDLAPREALMAVKPDDFCFLQDTGDPALDALLCIKKTALELSLRNPSSFPVMHDVFRSVDDALAKFP